MCDSGQNCKSAVIANSLPGVSLVVVSDGDIQSRKDFERHVAGFSIKNVEIAYVGGFSEDLPEKASKEYVAIVRVGDRYVNEYALESLVNTAVCEQADVVGGIHSRWLPCVSDFVFSARWLRENRDLLRLLEADGQAFVSAAIGRASKHVVRDRVYTETSYSQTEPLVSVVVPAYNAEAYLDRCLKSLAVQTHRNLEIIVVDDGSTDATAAIADRWADKDVRIKVVHKCNGGLSSARNAGMKIACGKYIGFVDADDYVEPDMFGDMADVLETHPFCDLAKCGVDVEYTYSVSETELASTQAYFANPARGEIRPGFDVITGTDVCAVDKLYRLEFLKNNGITFPEGSKNEDEAFFFAVFCRCRGCFYLPSLYYHYLRNPEGIMARQVADAAAGTVPDAVKVYEFVAELLLRENRRDLLGVLYRHMVGFVQRFLGTPIENAVCDAVAGVLRKTDAFYYADLICGESRQWVQRRVFELLNRTEPRDLPRFDVPEAWFPSVAPPFFESVKPMVSFIVPVYNVEKYIAATLESLRRQTLQNFEVVCIDDGSIDDSGKILDFYSRIDHRIHVWHVENGGVSAARNLGLEKARGRYVAFVDGDDRLHARMAASTTIVALRDDLDAVMFDYRCFAHGTMENIDHYWRLAHHIKAFPQDRVFSPGELRELSVYGSSCTFLWKREFLLESGVAFPGMKLGEDLVWVLSVLSRVRRMRVVNKPFYEYRRGNPSSAVSRLQTRESDAPVLALKGLAGVVAATPGSRFRKIMLKRMVSDILFYGKKFPKARAWLCSGGFDLFGGVECIKRAAPDDVALQIDELRTASTSADRPGIEYFIKQTPRSVQKIMRKAIAERDGAAKDLIVVAGQLNSTSNEPIDSWTFFRWLQDHGVPSRYVVWRKHSMVGRMRADNGLKDVILLSGNGVDNYEFIEKCSALLPRLRAVVMENTALNPLTWRYFHMLDGCSYIFLQHGPTFWKMAPKHIGSFAVANYVNVASESEKEFLEKHVPEHWETGRKPQYLIAGLPRWDLLKDESGGEREKVVFYMPTWRTAFNDGMDAIAKSAYFAGVRSLASEENIARLKRRNIRVVMAAHHHLVNRVKGLDFKLPIQLVPSSEVSYWIRHASLCITDYSSVSFDFLFLHKPCIFWTPDRYDGLLSSDDYAEVVFAEHQGENMFNRVQTLDEVMDMVEKYADAGFRLEPEKCVACDRYFAYRTGVCRRLYEQICAIDGKEANA